MVKSLSSLRKDTDKIDSKIIVLLAERDNVIKKIASYKKKYGLTIHDTIREKEIFTSVSQNSENLSLDSSYTKKLFNLILRHSNHLQSMILKRTVRKRT